MTPFPEAVMSICSGIEQDEFYNYVRSMTKIYAKKVGRYIKPYTKKKRYA